MGKLIPFVFTKNVINKVKASEDGTVGQNTLFTDIKTLSF